jgi:hypothetical protein
MIGIDDTVFAASNLSQTGVPVDSSLAGLLTPYSQAEEIIGESPTKAKVADIRPRLRAFIGREDQIYGDPKMADNVLSILHPSGPDGTNGLIFPYTPQITVNQSVNYAEIGLVHTNSDVYAYQRTPSVSLEISAKFTVQNQREGRYTLAALHFLRTVSKMYFGQDDKKSGRAGLPPPTLMFSGYGNWMFDNLPVVVKNHSYTLDDHVDMVTIQHAGGVARLPSMFQISLSLGVQQTPKRQRTAFSLDKFRTGELMRQNASSGTGWI